MSAIALATRGYIDSMKPPYVANMEPEVMTSETRPEVLARETGAPRTGIQEINPDVKPAIRPPRRRRNGNGGQ